jgi:flagellar motor switch/type III secretory pathway protein FliN
MFSLKPKEGGLTEPPSPSQGKWIPVVLFIAIVGIVVVGYAQYSSKAALEERILTLEKQLQEDVHQGIKQVRSSTNDLAADLEVVTKRLGVNAKELSDSRRFAEQLRQEQERAKEQLASELATKADTASVAAVREEATSQVAAVQKEADSKIGTVSGEVKTVAAHLETTRADLAASRREIGDVRTVLSKEIARNSSELADLRKKGERDYFEFDVRKAKKNQMQRIADIQLELRKTDTKKQKYDVVIQIDDSKREVKERSINEPWQFLVGRDQLRYEIVVNLVDKDRIRGYLSTPKDKVLAAERPAFRQQ